MPGCHSNALRAVVRRTPKGRLRACPIGGYHLVFTGSQSIPMTKSLAQVQEQISKLRKQAEAIRRREVAGVVRRIKVAIEAYGLTAEDLGLDQVKTKSNRMAKQSTESSKPSTRRSPVAVRKVPIKYRDGQGNAWSGRGLQPRWLKAALAEGRKLEDFVV